MIEIVAYDPADGWAVVKDADRGTLLVRPPYRQTDLRELSAGEACRSFVDLGFRVPRETVVREEWREIVDFLESEIRSAREWQDEFATGELGKVIADLAPDAVLTAWVDRAHDELISEGNLVQARAVLLTVIATAESRGLHEVVDRCKDALLEVAQLEHARVAFLTSSRVVISARFPRAALRYGEQEVGRLAAEVAHRHQVLPLEANA